MGRPKKWTDDLCLEALRRYTQENDTPSEAGYEMWRKKVGGVPSSRAIARVFGSWNATRMKSEDDAEGRVVLNNRRWTEAEILQAVRQYEEYAKQAGKPATARGYRVWHTLYSDTTSPSHNVILCYGTWNELRLRAAEHSEDVQINHAGRRKL